MPTSEAQTPDCIFCAIVRGGAPATFLHQDDLVVAFMDIRPGYGIEPPRAELETIADQIRRGLPPPAGAEPSGF
jgi:hypothetical protein